MTRNPFEDFDLPHGFDKPMTPPELAQFILCEENHTEPYVAIRHALHTSTPASEVAKLISGVDGFWPCFFQQHRKTRTFLPDGVAALVLHELLVLTTDDEDDDLSPFGDVA